MPRLVITVLLALLLLVAVNAPALANGDVYTVQAGDTLSSIAAQYGLHVNDLAAANGLRWNSWVYTGQNLVIPGYETASYSPSPAVSTGGTYTVAPGDTLSSVATRFGVSEGDLQTANNLANANFIFSGQRLTIPGSAGNAEGMALDPTPGAVSRPAIDVNANEKWIDVNLSSQTLTAYEGRTAVFERSVSTGLGHTPTVVGTFEIYVKYPAALMTGGSGAGYYYLPNVPYVMYFYGNYGLHGTYWHNSFGAPMSRGCVNLATPDAEWLYNWAPLGTKVVTHY